MRLPVAHARPRLAALLLAALTAVLLLTLWGPALPAARAQEGGEAAPAAGGEANKPAAAPAQSKSISPWELFIHIVKSVGWVFGIVLLFTSIGLVALIVLLAMELRLGSAIPPGFVEDFTDTVNKRRFKEAYEMAKEDGSFLGRVLTTGMSRLQYGIDDAREASLNMVDSVKAGKDQLVTYLATIGTLGPMLGLVGTVWGMILSFMELSRPGSTPRPDKLADGISHALVVTLLGIGLSVPAIFCHAFFKNRLTRLSMEVSNVADDLLTQMYHNSKRPAAAPTAAPAVEVDGRAAAAAAVKQK